MALEDLTVLICDPDPAQRGAISQLAEENGFAVVGEVDRIHDGIEVGRLVGPNLAVISDELAYAEGLTGVREFHEALPSVEILFITRDESVTDEAREAGAFGVLYRDRLDELPGALGRVGEWIASADERPRNERRTGRDRRTRQDWRQVTSERRQGDRRDRENPEG